jgi:hypothetical protein
MLFDTQIRDIESEIVLTAENSNSTTSKSNSCRNLLFAISLLCSLKFNPQSLPYSNLILAYKFMLTLSSSQVACERSFLKLKYILNIVRNLLSQSSLESFSLMACANDLLRIRTLIMMISLALTSDTMKKLLV